MRSALSSGDHHPANSSNSQMNLGQIAHKAVERWIKSGTYLTDVNGQGLQRLFDEQVTLLQMDVTELANGVLTRMRLEARAKELQALLNGQPGAKEIYSEEFVQDDEQRIRGVIDLALTGDRKSVVDLKTGNVRSSRSVEMYELQLALYAHLYDLRWGFLPDSWGVFSLERGLRLSLVDHESVGIAIDSVLGARNRILEEALPRDGVCILCSRRIECSEYWRVLPDVDARDALAGDVESIHSSSDEVHSFVLRCNDEQFLLCDVPDEVLAARSGDETAFRAIGLIALRDSPSLGFASAFRFGSQTRWSWQ